jgi:hypothetical protein
MRSKAPARQPTALVLSDQFIGTLLSDTNPTQFVLPQKK